MKRFITALLLTLAPLPALAWDGATCTYCDGNGPIRNVNTDPGGVATSEATSASTATSSSQGGSSSASGGNVSSNINYEQSASTAYAAALTASFGTCMGSSSVGGQGVGFGVSVGSTWTDDDCNRRRYAAILQSLGETEAAIQLLCLNKEVQQVMPRCVRSPAAVSSFRRR